MKRSLVLLVLVWSLFANPAVGPPFTTTVFAGQRRVAQQPRDTSRTSAPQGTAAAPARLPQAQLVNRILANGLEVIVLEDHSVPLITIEAAVRNGSFTEPPELNGLSHLYEHMFFKANKDYPKPDEFAARFLKLAEDNAKDAVGLDAAAWLVQNVGSGAESQKAVEILISNHVKNPKIGPVCLPLLYSGSPEAEKFVRAVLEKNPTKEAQGLACYALARYLKNNARGDVNKEWEGLFERAAEKYGDVKYGTRTVADMAKGELFEIRNLAIGKTAPDIEGEDIDGKKFKLSDYCGKVVVLDFWGNW